ncbi:MAG TPA: nucleotidyltransferase domain-containing protein [Chthoniobacterales bacterium]|nr:nucleotidyltransferase domain-containing protein [Chthoniobacterales bacterium]
MILTEDQICIVTDYFRDTPVVAVYLFGSYARGDADSRSDIDLLVQTDVENRCWTDLRRYKRELADRLKLPIDLFEQHKIFKYALADIFGERVLIYSRTLN